MKKYSELFVIIAMLLLILGQPLWIFHSIFQGYFLLKYGENFYEAINGLWIYADIIISIIFFILSVPFIILAFEAGELWILKKFIIWSTIAFLSPIIIFGIVFFTKLKLTYSTFLLLIPPLILLILPIYWTFKFWHSNETNTESE